MNERRKKAGRLQVEVPIEVPFHDVDGLGVVWHGHIYKYIEIARTALFREVGLEKRPGEIEKVGRDENNFSLRVVESRCRHLMPLYYGDQLKVRAWFRDINEQFAAMQIWPRIAQESRKNCASAPCRREADYHDKTVARKRDFVPFGARVQPFAGISP